MQLTVFTRGCGASESPPRVLVDKKEGDDPAVVPLVETTFARGLGVLRQKMNDLPLRLYPNRDGYFSAQWTRDSVPAKVTQLKPDVVNLHWILNGFVQIKSLREFNQPLVWTLHDMWAFTGGCVHSLWTAIVTPMSAGGARNSVATTPRTCHAGFGGAKPKPGKTWISRWLRQAPGWLSAPDPVPFSWTGEWRWSPMASILKPSGL